MWPFREKILDSGGVVTIEGEERKRKPSTYYVVPCMFIFMAYTFMCIPLLQESVILLNCNNYYLDANGHNTTSPYPIEISNDDRCDKSEISSSANKWYMYLSASSSAVSIFTTGTLGAITDKYGRRLAMILPCLGAMAQAAIIVILTHLDMSLPYYFIPQLLLGLTGGATTFLMACFSYSADCSNLSKRSLEIGLLEAAMFLGGTVGPISEGYLVELYNVDVPLITFAGALVPVVIWILWIPESLPPSRKVASVSWKKANIFGALSILFSPSVYGDRWTLLFLGCAFSTVFVNSVGFSPVMVSYTKYVSFLKWHDSTIGIFLAVDWLLKGLAILIVVPICTIKFKKYISEYGLANFAFLAQSLAYVLYAFANSTATFFSVSIVSSFGIICVPVMRSLFSMNVGVNEQGSIFSAISAIESLFSLVAPLIYSNIYTASVDSMPNLAFLIMGGANVIPFILIVILRRVNSQKRLSADRSLNSSETQPILSRSVSTSSTSSLSSSSTNKYGATRPLLND